MPVAADRLNKRRSDWLLDFTIFMSVMGDFGIFSGVLESSLN